MQLEANTQELCDIWVMKAAHKFVFSDKLPSCVLNTLISYSNQVFVERFLARFSWYVRINNSTLP